MITSKRIFISTILVPILLLMGSSPQAKITQFNVEDVQLVSSQDRPGAVDVRTKWTALGTVGHWGHVHTRRNLYDAILTLAVSDGSWKIVGIEVVEEKRIDPFAQQAQPEDSTGA